MSVVAHSGCVPFSLRDTLCQVIEPLEVALFWFSLACAFQTAMICRSQWCFGRGVRESFQNGISAY